MISEKQLEYLSYWKKKLHEEYKVTQKGGSDWRRGNVLGKIEVVNKMIALLKCEELIKRR